MAKLGRGITNKQAKYLAALCREMKVAYMGRGLTSQEASTAIATLQAKVDEKREAQKRNLERRLKP